MPSRYTVSNMKAEGMLIDPEGSQPAYTRGKAQGYNEDLASFRSCMAMEMEDSDVALDEGEKAGDYEQRDTTREEVQDAFESSYESCKGELG